MTKHRKILTLLLLMMTLFSCAKKEETVEEAKPLDQQVPVIEISEYEISCADPFRYDYESNVQVTYGADGGNTAFILERDGSDLIVNVDAKGNNGMRALDSFLIRGNSTEGKSVIVFGDSIVYGILADRYSFANFLNDDYDFAQVVNAGYSDYRLSTYDDANKWLIDAVKRHYDDEYDFVLLEGGVNDVLYLTPIGEIASDKDYDSFDVDTFCGGLEAYLYTVTSRWPNARIGYIITYYTKDYTERGLSWSYEDYKEYYDIQKEILDKWGIEYLDLFTDDFSELLQVETRTYLPDKLHLNRAGHELITPYIYEWMKGLKPYS